MSRVKKRDYPVDKSPAAHARVETVADRYHFDDLSERYNLPDKLAESICLVESEGKPWRASGKNCIGLFQVALGTTRDMKTTPRGLSDAQLTELLKTNPQVNANTGTKYMRWLARELNKENERLQADGRGLSFDILDANGAFTEKGTAVVIAAYNTGLGNIKKNIRRNGDEWYAHLPTETHNYVLDVMSHMNLTPPMLVAVKPLAMDPKEASAAWEKARYIDEIAERTNTQNAAALDAAFRSDPQVVAALQKSMHNAGYGVGKADGKAGPKFEVAWDKLEAAQLKTPNADAVVADGLVSLSEIGMLLAPKVTRGAAKPVDGPLPARK